MLQKVHSRFISNVALSVSLLAVIFSFAAWFANQQISVGFGLSWNNYPFTYYLITLYKVGLYVFALMLFWIYLLDVLSPGKATLARMVGCFLPLSLVVVNVQLSACIVLVMLVSIGLFIPSVSRIRQIVWQRKTDLLVLILLILWCTCCKYADIYSPYHWSRAILNLRIEEISTTAQLYKGFIWAKQYSFSNVDYAQWAAVMHSSNSLNSPLLQLLALVLNAPSIDVKAFHKIILMILYFLAIFGSFGFYLYIRYALSARASIAFIGSLLFIFGNLFFWAAMGLDSFIFITGYLLFPYALLGLFYSFKNNSTQSALWAGVALACPFYILSPHPELTIYLFFCYFIIGTSNILFIGQYDIRRLEATKKFLISVFVFLILSLFHVGPILWDTMRDNLHIFGHPTPINYYSTVLPPVTADPLGSYFYLVVLSAPIVFLHQLIKRQVFPHFFAWLVIALMIVTLNSLNMISHYLPIIDKLGRMTVHLNLGSAWRLQLIFALSAIIIFCCALNSLFFLATGIICVFQKLLRQFNCNQTIFYLMLIATTILFDVSVLMYDGYALHKSKLPFVGEELPAVTSVAKLENPENCDYYIGMNAILANYQGLKSDRANLYYIKSRLISFERDLQHAPINNLIIPYKLNYSNLLHQYGVQTVSAISDANIINFANGSKNTVDDFYLDKHFNCVNPLLTHVNEISKRIVRYNLDALYKNIPTRFQRILGGTVDDSHLGLGAGMFVHNNTVTFDNRFMMGYPLLHALYVLPQNDFAQLGSYESPNVWNIKPSNFLDGVGRHIFDVSGIDIMTLSAEIALPQSKQLQPIDYTLPQLVNPHYAVYYNQNSYGMAYLANKISIQDPLLIQQDENIIRSYFKQKTDITAFHKVTADLYANLMQLKNKHDVLVERNKYIVPIDNQLIPSSNVSINNIVGEKASMLADCKKASCLFVFNVADFPGWKAFVNQSRVPIYRVNYAFMGIDVPRGISQIWFIFQPWSALLFTSMSLFGFIFVVGYGWYRRSGVQHKLTSMTIS